MKQPVPSSSRTTDMRRRRAADDILIAAIYGLSERDEPTTPKTTPNSEQPRRSPATAAAVG